MCLWKTNLSLVHSSVAIWLSIAKDCLLTLVKSRLALGSPGCLFVCSFVCHHAKNGPIRRKMVIDYPLVITSKVKLFFRPDKNRRKEWKIQPVLCTIDAGSFYFGCLRTLQKMPIFLIYWVSSLWRVSNKWHIACQCCDLTYSKKQSRICCANGIWNP